MFTIVTVTVHLPEVLKHKAERSEHVTNQNQHAQWKHAVAYKFKGPPKQTEEVFRKN